MKLPISTKPINRINNSVSIAQIKAANGLLNGPLPPSRGNCAHKGRLAMEGCLDKYCLNFGRFGRGPCHNSPEYRSCVRRATNYIKRGCKGSIPKP